MIISDEIWYEIQMYTEVTVWVRSQRKQQYSTSVFHNVKLLIELNGLFKHNHHLCSACF